MMAEPTPSTQIRGGNNFGILGNDKKKKKVRDIAVTRKKSSEKARIQLRPNCTNTPATMPITMGIGNQSITFLINPVKPKKSNNKPVITYAPMTSLKDREFRAEPTRIAPGIVHKKTSGCR